VQLVLESDLPDVSVDPALFATGRQAFFEYMPLADLPLNDPTCAGRPLFRVFFWGKDVQIIMLDQRSCRSADVEAACGNDLVPTLPQPVRALLSALTGFPLPPVPQSCLDAIADPSRTLLGPAQKALFKLALQAPAKFKFVINGPPIQQLYALPYDRWEGYAAERAEILDFIRTNNIQNVTFLSTDLHTNLVNEVFLDAFADPTPIAREVVTGPIAEFTFEEEIRLFANPSRSPLLFGFEQALVNGFNLLLDGVLFADCRNLGGTRPLLLPSGTGAIFTYAVVDVNAGAGTATVTLKDANGAPVVNLGGVGTRALTLGP
jgi:hypothetical protein